MGVSLDMAFENGHPINSYFTQSIGDKTLCRPRLMMCR
jgi:hypothetical protein